MNYCIPLSYTYILKVKKVVLLLKKLISRWQFLILKSNIGKKSFPQLFLTKHNIFFKFPHFPWLSRLTLILIWFSLTFQSAHTLYYPKPYIIDKKACKLSYNLSDSSLTHVWKIGYSSDHFSFGFSAGPFTTVFYLN